MELACDLGLHQLGQRSPTNEVALLPSRGGTVLLFGDPLDLLLEMDVRRSEDDLLTVFIDQLIDDHLGHVPWRIRDRLGRQAHGRFRALLITSVSLMPLYEYRCQ